MNRNFQIIQYPDAFDNNKITQFNQEIEEIVRAGVNVVLLDLKNITSITSAGLMALVEAFTVVKSSGCKVFLCSLSEQVRMLFELTGLDQVFETVANLDEFTSTMVLKK